MTSKSQAIARARAQVLQIQRQRTQASAPAPTDHTRILALGVCDSISYATKGTGKFSPPSRSSMWSAAAWAFPVILFALGILAAAAR